MLGKRIQKISSKHQGDARRQLKAIAKSLRRKRTAMRLSQEAFAERLNISVETVKVIEQERGWVSLQMLFYLCSELKMKITIG